MFKVAESEPYLLSVHQAIYLAVIQTPVANFRLENRISDSFDAKHLSQDSANESLRQLIQTNSAVDDTDIGDTDARYRLMLKYWFMDLVDSGDSASAPSVGGATIETDATASEVTVTELWNDPYLNADLDEDGVAFQPQLLRTINLPHVGTAPRFVTSVLECSPAAPQPHTDSATDALQAYRAKPARTVDQSYVSELVNWSSNDTRFSTSYDLVLTGFSFSRQRKDLAVPSNPPATTDHLEPTPN
jgi:hypothetical protein